MEGTIQIKGTAECPDFTHYTLIYSPVSDPEQQTPIAEYFEPVHNGKLADWDTTAVPDGDYSLTLTVFDSGGPDATDSVEVRLDNQPPAISFSSPGSEGVVVSPFAITGTVSDAHLKSWKLSAESASPLLLSHLDGNTTNERTGDDGRLEGDPDYPNARFSSGLHIDQGQGLSYPRDHNIEKERGTVEFWLIPDWAGGEQSEHLLFSTKTADFSNPTDCLMLSKVPEGLSFSLYDHAGGMKTCLIPTTDENLPAGTQAFVAATWDNGNICLYLNGVPATGVQGGGTGILSDMGRKLYVGFYPEAELEADATFDELSIYDYARPVSVIRADCLAESAKTLGDTKTTIARGEDPVDNSLLGTATVDDGPAEALFLSLEAKDDFNLKSNVEERVFTDNPDPAAIISSPGEGEQVSGLVTVEGTCFDMDLASWALSAKPGEASSPGTWIPIASGNEAVWRGGIASWDTSAYSGPASLKLEVTDSHGKSAVATRTVSVLSAGPLTADIISPAEGQAVDSPFQVTGTASGANFSGYTLEYREKSPSFLSHFNDNTRNERDADAGTITGSPAFQPGKFENGLFIATGDTLRYPTTGNIQAEEGTVELWVTPNWSASESHTRMLFFTPPTSGYSNMMALAKDSGHLLFYTYDQSGQPKVVSLPVTEEDIQPGIPFHLGATWDNGDIRLYLNGREALPAEGQPGTGIFSSLGQDLYVGSSTYGMGAEAVIDEVSIYPWVRPQAAILEDALSMHQRTYHPDWETVVSSAAPVSGGFLGTVPNDPLPGEGVELRLTASAAGQSEEDSVSLVRDSASPRAAITEPEEGGLVYGTKAIRGTATDIDLASYQLFYKAGTDPGSPEPWVPACPPGSAPVIEGTLGEWDASSLADGDYLLRLLVTDSNGKSATADRPVVVNNQVPTAQITFPEDGGAVAESCEIRGTASGPNFTAYSLSYRFANDQSLPEEWTPIGEESTTPVTDGVLGTWDTSSLPEVPCVLRLQVRGIPGMVITHTVGVQIDHTLPLAEITSPADGSTVAGYVRIEGSATDANFSSYSLQYAEETAPNDWHPACETATEQVSSGTLGYWNTEGMPDGAYLLRLSVTDSAGHCSEDVVHLRVENPSSYTVESISIEPEGAMLAVAETQGFTCLATDAQGYLHLVTPAWEALGGNGAIDSAGLFTATCLGLGTVRATYQSFVCEAPTSVVTKLPGGVLSQDTVLDPSMGTVVPQGWLVVPRGVKLTVQPGTLVKSEGTGFYVEGDMEVVGGCFTSLADDSVSGDSNANRQSEGAPGDWAGVYFSASATDPGLTNTRVLYAGASTDLEIAGGRHVTSSSSVYVAGGSPAFVGCEVSHSANDGISTLDADLTCEANSIHDNGAFGLKAMSYWGGKSADLHGNTFSGGPVGAWLFRIEDVEAGANTFSNLSTGLSVNDNYGAGLSLLADGNAFQECHRALEVTAQEAPGGVGITNNSFVSCGTYELRVMVIEPTQATTDISGNTFTSPNDTGGYAIAVNPGTNDTQISSNDISGYGTGIIAGSRGYVTVTGNNISYSGSDPWSIGIQLENAALEEGVVAESVVCSQNRISGFTCGIYVGGDSTHYMRRVSILHNFITGPGDSVQCCWGVVAQTDGVPYECSLGLEANSVENCVIGAQLYGVPYVTVKDYAYATHPGINMPAIGFLLECGQAHLGQFALLRNNVVTGPGVAFMVRNYLMADVMNNQITGELTDPYSMGALVDTPAWNGDLCTVRGNTINDKAIGFTAEGYDQLTVDGNAVTSNIPHGACGGFSAEGYNVVAFNNQVVSTGGGISFHSEESARIEANQVTAGTSGIVCDFALGAQVKSNTMTGFWAGEPNNPDDHEYSEGLSLNGFSGTAIGNNMKGYGFGVSMENPRMDDGYVPRVKGNIIAGNRWGFECTQASLIVDGTENWWGHGSGPWPYGDCNGVLGYVNVQPWGGQTVFYGRVNGNDPHCPCLAEPVNVITGNFTSSHTDLDFSATGPHIGITRTYNSIGAPYTEGPLGFGWDCLLTERIETFLPVYVEGDALLTTPDGAKKHYMRQQDGRTYLPEDEDYTVLVKNQDGSWRLRRKDASFESFDAEGRIVAVTEPAGNTLSISRDSDGRAVSMTDACGQSATLTYDEEDRITRLTDPAGRHISYSYDENGDLVKVTDLAGGQTLFSYDWYHYLESITDPKGVTFVTNTYNTSGRVLAQADAHGNVSNFDYDAAAHESSYTDARQNTTRFTSDRNLYNTASTDAHGNGSSVTYDDDGNLTSQTDRNGNTTNYTYDESGNMTSETDPCGKTTGHTYDSRGNRLTTTDPLGATTSRIYDAANNLTSETDALGNTTTYTYDTAGRLLTTTDPLEHTTSNTYDGKGNLTSVENPDGGVTINTYDAANRKLTTTDPVGATTSFTYDAMGHLLTMTDACGGVYSYAYDSDGNQVSETDPHGKVWRTEYDAMGRVSKQIDPLGAETTFAYDANGNKTEETDSLGHTTLYAYDQLGREISTTDPREHTSSRTYDPEGNVLTETDRQGKTTTSTYDVCGHLETRTDPLGNQTGYEYDDCGHEVKVTDPQGNYTSSSYDAAGRLVSSTDATGAVTAYEYDECGNRVSVTDPEGHVSRSAYDSMNRLVSMTDPEGRTTSFAYDLNGRKTATTDGTGATTTLAYDPRGLLIRATDPRGDSVTYTYDECGRRLGMTDPKGGVTTYAYDDCGKLLSETNPLGQTTSHTYDDAGRLLSKTDGMGTTTYTCDENGNPTRVDYPDGQWGMSEQAVYDAEDRPAQRSNQYGPTAFTYDDAGRLTSVANFLGTTTATYDEAGRITGKRVSGQNIDETFSYSYDAAGRMTESTHGTTSATYTYSPAGSLSTVSYPNGVSSTYAYDASGMTSGLAITRGADPLKTYEVARDARADITAITEDGTSQTTYGYDAASCLTHESSPWSGPITYAYDESGNRLARDKGGQITTYTYGPGDQLLSDSQGNTYTYNSRGDLVRVERDTYSKDLTWDGKGRLTGVSDTEGLNAMFAYDSLDRTLASSENGQLNIHLYDMASDMEVATLDENQNPTALFQGGAGGLVSATTSEGTSYFSGNTHSDVALVTDPDGSVTSDLHYDAWGNVAEPTEEPFGYVGKHQRRSYRSLGLIKMGARFYDPDTGRFISRDPLSGDDELPITKNPYIYANDDPVNMKDLSGESALGDYCRNMARKCLLRLDFVMAAYWILAGRYCDWLEAQKQAATPPAQTPTNPSECPTQTQESASESNQRKQSLFQELVGGSDDFKLEADVYLTRWPDANLVRVDRIASACTVAGMRIYADIELTVCIEEKGVTKYYDQRNSKFGPGFERATHAFRDLLPGKTVERGSRLDMFMSTLEFIGLSTFFPIPSGTTYPEIHMVL